MKTFRLPILTNTNTLSILFGDFYVFNTVQMSQPTTNTRKIWITITELMTCCIPNIVLMKDVHQRQAWREKVTLFMLIILSSSSIIFIIGILPKILCPTETGFYKWDAIWSSRDNLVVAHGNVYDVEKIIALQDDSDTFISYLGQDVSKMFYKEEVEKIDILEYNTTKEILYNQNPINNKCMKEGDEYEDIDTGKTINCQNIRVLGEVKGKLSLTMEDLYKDETKKWFYIYNNVYDVTDYLSKATKFGRCLIDDSNLFDNIEWCHSKYKDLPYVNDNCGSVCVKNKTCYEKVNEVLKCNITNNIIETPFTSNSFFFDDRLNKVLKNKINKNATVYFNNIFEDLTEEKRQEIIKYLDELFFTGIIESNFIVVCYILDIVFLAVMIAVASIIVFKFLTALFILAKQYPEEKNKYVIINMPVYTENIEEIQKSIYAIADMEYSDYSKKLLFVVADGVITGKGNDKPSCELVLNVLGRSLDEESESYEYNSLGDGDNKINNARVFTGIFQNTNNPLSNLPYVVVVKIGNDTEKTSSTPGNRGKRDSQLVLFNFLSNIYYKNELNSLESKFFYDIENIIGTSPHDYEYLMCIDCDTEPANDALKQLIYKMSNDHKIIGLCGETKIANKTQSWVTAIQVYEYYINHNLTKAFESLFGNVTCLPGCFTMYRIKSTGRKIKPFVIHKDILVDYSITNVDTLHMKNLLYLGEDRYLTTLITKKFPKHSLKYMIEATCKTIVPHTWGVLLSQRRRWVNSTFHNLLELVLVQNMCGLACFSMRFIIVLDLIATVFLPASVLFLYYLIYIYATGAAQIETVMIIVLSIVYIIPILVFLIKRQPEFFIWYVLYLIAMPIWTIIIPVYSFWKFDDFSWGKTREITIAPQPIDNTVIEYISPETIIEIDNPDTLSIEVIDTEVIDTDTNSIDRPVSPSP
jgi:chitin synthase